MASIEFKNISKQFENGTVALKDFNLRVEDGQFIVLVGASGCGKSTALRLLAGLETPSSGEILINNSPVNQVSPQQRNIAMVFQNYALYPHMSVAENLAFPLKMSGSSKAAIESGVNNIAKLLGIDDLMERKPAQLSGGQRQRVAMGRALVREPSVFLLDEPLSNLDAKLRTQIRSEIAQIQKRLKITTVYVTHDQTEAMTLGDRIAVLNNGELQQVGTPEELYEHPANIFVAKFVGNPGMNLLRSRVTGLENQQLGLTLHDVQVPLESLNKSTAEILRMNTGKEVYVGIRPEAFSVTPFEGNVCVKLKINDVEYLGHESLLHLNFTTEKTDSDKATIVARLPGQLPGYLLDSSETAISLYFDPTSISVFDSKERRVV